MMSIEEAIGVFQYKAKKYRNPKEMQAVNTLIEYINAQDKKITQDNKLFAKLFLERFIELAKTGELNANQCIESIERTLSMRIIDMVNIFKEEVPYFKFELYANKGTKGLDPIKDFGKIKAIRNSNALRYKAELLEALRTEYTEEQAIRFLEHQVNRLIKVYSNTP